MLKKFAVSFHALALVVEKKNPLSIDVRYDELSEVVATTLPFTSVARRDEVTPVIAREVVVAFVVIVLVTRLFSV